MTPVLEVPDRWVELFGKGWHSVPAGKPGDRRRAGLALVLDDLRRQVYGLWLTSDTDHEYNDGYECAKREMLDILDTGGSDDCTAV